MFQFLAEVLAFFYGLLPNYAVAIALLTLSVMLVLSPLTLKSTRSMLAMQRLQPEVKRIQQKHKGGDRQQMNQEMMALYKEHQVNPMSGCLPMLAQFPVLIVMYHVIRGLTTVGKGPCRGFNPKYLDHGSKLYEDLCASGREMMSFGIDLSKTAGQAFERSVGAGLPFLVLVGLVVFVQYYQSKQMTRRNPQATVSPQMQMMTRVMPVMFGVFSFAFPAALNVYFIMSGVFRVAQQGAMYRWDPTLVAHVRDRAKEVEAKSKPKAGDKGGKGDKGARAGDKARADGKKAQARQTAKQNAKQNAKKAGAKARADGKKAQAKGNGARPTAKSGANGKASHDRRPKSSKKGKGGDRGRARKRRAKKGR